MDKYDYESPVGWIEISADNEALLGIHFQKEAPITPSKMSNSIIDDCLQQLEQYFSGTLTEFKLPFVFTGTPFQNKVWQGLQHIPFGQTISYKDFAIQLGDVKAIRAVAHSNGLNPFAVAIPCHRVIGSDGTLTGYSGGLWRKQWLLDHENKIKPTGQQRMEF